MKIFKIEGNQFRLDGGSMFGNAPKALWQKWVKADDQNRILLSSRALLVQTDQGRNILFETGVGNFFEPKMKERFGIYEKDHCLITNLAKIGIRDKDIDAIVLSHLHFDHAGGLLSSYEEGPLKLLFSNAKYYLSKMHWERAQNPHIREKASFIPLLHKLLEESGRLILIDGSFHSDFDFVTFRYSYGHTIGLMLAQIQLEETPLVFASDLVPGIPWVNLPIAMGYDRFPELTINEKEILFREMIEKKGKLFFTHDSNNHAACLVMENGTYKTQTISVEQHY